MGILAVIRNFTTLDEGTMATCLETDPRTESDCCGRIVVTSGFANLKYTECTKSGTYGATDQYECDLNMNIQGTHYSLCIRQRLGRWSVDLCDINYSLSSNMLGGTCPTFGEWIEYNNPITVRCMVAGWDNPNECDNAD